MRRPKGDLGYRLAVAKTAGARERTRGLSSRDTASNWLRLTPAERRELARHVHSEADLAAWLGLTPAERREFARQVPKIGLVAWLTRRRPLD